MQKVAHYYFWTWTQPRTYPALSCAPASAKAFGTALVRPDEFQMSMRGLLRVSAPLSLRSKRYVSGKIFFCSFSHSRQWSIDYASTFPKMEIVANDKSLIRCCALALYVLCHCRIMHEYFTLRRDEPNVSHLPKFCVTFTHLIGFLSFKFRSRFSRGAFAFGPGSDGTGASSR